MQNISKRLIVAIIVLIIAIVVGGLFWYFSKAPMQQQVVPVMDNQGQQGSENQTQETSTAIIARNLDVSTWKTYRNEEYGIEFKYPEELFDLTENRDSNAALFLDLSQKNFFGDKLHYVQIALNTLKSDKEYYAESQKDTGFLNVDISGKQGKIYGMKSDMNEKEKMYNNFVHQGDCFSFSASFDYVKKTSQESLIIVQCNDNVAGMSKIYGAIYKSIHFSR